MKFIPGFVSISFRSLSSEEIVKLCKDNGLAAIEWGSDVHANAEKPETVVEARKLSDEVGISVPEYGAYYNLGENNDGLMQKLTESARVLGTNVIRIWAGEKTRSEMSDEEYGKIVCESQRFCDKYPGINFCLECHNWTITAEYHDALTFLSDVNRPNFNMFWQPNHFLSHEYNKEALTALLPYVYSVHVFSWEGKDGKAVFYPLDYHTDRWADYLEILKSSPRDKIYLMLEFMHDNDPASVPATAKTLREWIDTVQKG